MDPLPSEPNACTEPESLAREYVEHAAPACKTEPPAVLDTLEEHAHGEVELCKRTADLPGARELDVKHHWIRTASKEAGMGAKDGGVPGHHLDVPFVTKVTVNDHTGEGAKPGASCETVPNVDAACVDRELELGKDLGRWTPTNQCQTFAAGVLAHCRKG